MADAPRMTLERCDAAELVQALYLVAMADGRIDEQEDRAIRLALVADVAEAADCDLATAAAVAVLRRGTRSPRAQRLLRELGERGWSVIEGEREAPEAA